MAPRDRYELLSLRIDRSTKVKYDRSFAVSLYFLEKAGKTEFDNLRLVEPSLMDFEVHTHDSHENGSRQIVVHAVLAVESYFLLSVRDFQWSKGFSRGLG